jgi:uncharacterized protein YcbX
MVVDADGLLISQRDHPGLATVEATVVGDSLRIRANDREVGLALAPDGERRRVVVWDDAVEAIMASVAADRLLSDFLGLPCRLAWMPDAADRLTAPRRGEPRRQVSFADAAPVLLLSEAAHDDLSARLLAAGAEPVPIDRFRANIVLRRVASPSEDDRWTSLQIGDATLRVSNACKRCQVVTIDQAKGARTGAEPLRTLATYRREGDAVTFGQHALVERPGTVAVGDAVRVLASSGGRERRPPLD